MALFSNLLSRIWGQAETATPPAASTEGAPTATPTAETPAPPPPPPAPLDVAPVLNGLAATQAERLDWQHSIVDLLKLVDLDSSLAARKGRATELGDGRGVDGPAGGD